MNETIKQIAGYRDIQESLIHVYVIQIMMYTLPDSESLASSSRLLFMFARLGSFSLLLSSSPGNLL